MKYLCFSFLFIALLGFKGSEPEHISLIKYRLGDTTVIIRRESYGPGKVFVHLHANETTALKAARWAAKKHGGQVITLVHDKTRDIYFKYHGRHYAFDPNRIFTAKGIEKTLKQHHSYSPRAKNLISGLAKKILTTIPRGKIVAVHNNKDYSLRDYLPHHRYAKDAKHVYRRPQQNFRNFFLVTQEKDFKRYRHLGFNVIHQAHHASDDGSLSIIFSKKTYVNAEAGFNQLRQQQTMLEKA